MLWQKTLKNSTNSFTYMRRQNISISCECTHSLHTFTEISKEMSIDLQCSRSVVVPEEFLSSCTRHWCLLPPSRDRKSQRAVSFLGVLYASMSPGLVLLQQAAQKETDQSEAPAQRLRMSTRRSSGWVSWRSLPPVLGTLQVRMGPPSPPPWDLRTSFQILHQFGFQIAKN